MTIATIDFSYLDECATTSGTWTGEKREARRDALDALDGQSLGDKQGEDNAYYAEEGDGTKWYRITDDETIELGAALLAGIPMDRVYSLWCASSGSPMTEEECDEAGIEYTIITD